LRDYLLDLSILLSRGKGINRDSLSRGDRRAKQPILNPTGFAGRNCGVRLLSFLLPTQVGKVTWKGRVLRDTKPVTDRSTDLGRQIDSKHE
jgi:ABC-type iron transport system FetAB ATPase subunit